MCGLTPGGRHKIKWDKKFDKLDGKTKNDIGKHNGASIKTITFGYSPKGKEMKKDTTIKNDIITVMGQVSSEEVLRAVYTILEREARYEHDLLSPFYEPSEGEKATIEEGLKDIAEGRTYSHEEVTAKYREKYGK